MSEQIEIAEPDPGAPSVGASPPVRGLHYPALDGLRGVAVLLIFIHHGLDLAGRSPLTRAVHTFARAGWTGVTLFFVLSGFLISGILLDARGSRGYFVNFYARRSLRIFPLYYGFLVFLIYLAPAAAHWAYGTPAQALPNQFVFWAYLANFRDVLPTCPAPIPFDPLWSLAVEEQVYLVWPAFIALCPRRWLVWVLTGVVPAALVWRVGGLALHRSFSYSYMWTPACLDAFAAGAIVAALIRRPGGLEWVRARTPWVFALSGTFLAGIWFGGRTLDFWANATVLLTIGMSALSVFFAATIAGLVTGAAPRPLIRVMSAPVLRNFGRYSYGIYLFHVFLIVHIGDAVKARLGSGPRWHSLPVQLSFGLAVFACTYVLAFLSFHLYEKPFLSLKAVFPMPSRVRSDPE